MPVCAYLHDLDVCLCHANIHACTHVNVMNVFCMHVHIIHTCMCTCMHIHRLYTHKYKHMYTYTYIRTLMTHTHIHKYTQVCTQVHAYIQTRKYVHTNTCTYLQNLYHYIDLRTREDIGENLSRNCLFDHGL